MESPATPGQFISKKLFPLYLKELEFRYNYRQHDLFNKL
jgi:transposase-like protein